MSLSLYFQDASCAQVESDDINMSNRNAALVLSALGFSIDWESGVFETSVGEFEAACERYLSSEISSVIDNGRDSVESTGENGCVVIDCGLRDGYITERVQQILDASRKAHGATHLCFC